jgi:hypothetical protein
VIEIPEKGRDGRTGASHRPCPRGNCIAHAGSVYGLSSSHCKGVSPEAPEAKWPNSPASETLPSSTADISTAKTRPHKDTQAHLSGTEGTQRHLHHYRSITTNLCPHKDTSETLSSTQGTLRTTTLHADTSATHSGTQGVLSVPTDTLRVSTANTPRIHERGDT